MKGRSQKGEGDSFWMTFPSVTAAAIAATEMQQELRAAEAGKGNDARLAVRIVITLGDVLHQEKDIFGEAVNLAARIEAITPPDEIYLSQAAWLGLNKAELSTSYVGEFDLKGLNEKTRIYKLDQSHRTRIITNQTIVFSDLRGFSRFSVLQPVEAVEELLTRLESLHNEICSKFGGTVRFILGDEFFFTFREAERALEAVNHLCDEWDQFRAKNHIDCPIKVGVNKGDINQFRSFLYGTSIYYGSWIAGLSDKIFDPDSSVALVSHRVYIETRSGIWKERLRKVDFPEDMLAQLIPPTLTQDNVSGGSYSEPIYELIRQASAD